MCNGQMRALSQRGSQYANEYIYIFIIHKDLQINNRERFDLFSSHLQRNKLIIFKMFCRVHNQTPNYNFVGETSVDCPAVNRSAEYVQLHVRFI